MKIFTLLMLLPNACFAWSDKDTNREVAWQIINFIDYRQTVNLSKRQNEDFYEQNPLLGSNPSRGDVDKYFALAALGHLGISYALPIKYRLPWQWGSIGVSTMIVYNNHRIGLRVNFTY